jgi:hypothetical protein
VEGLEAFAEKKTEYNDLVDEMLGQYEASTREHVAYVTALQRTNEIAEERRLQEFHRALESMSPAEAEAALRAERERALRLEKEREIRAAELDAEIAREKVRVREKYSRYYSV